MAASAAMLASDPFRLLPALLPYRFDAVRYSCFEEAALVEPAAIAEQTAPPSVGHRNLDPETILSVVVPLTDVGDSREGHRETEAEPTLIEPLLPRPQTKPTALIHRKIDVNRQVFVR